MKIEQLKVLYDLGLIPQYLIYNWNRYEEVKARSDYFDNIEYCLDKHEDLIIRKNVLNKLLVFTLLTGFLVTLVNLMGILPLQITGLICLILLFLMWKTDRKLSTGFCTMILNDFTNQLEELSLLLCDSKNLQELLCWDEKTAREKSITKLHELSAEMLKHRDDGGEPYSPKMEKLRLSFKEARNLVERFGLKKELVSR